MRSFFSCVLFVVALFLPLCGYAQVPKQPAAWTIMVYMDGDNNLEYLALMDFLEMEQAIPDNVEIIVLLDRHKAYTTIFGNWTGARLYRVRRAAPFDMRLAASGQPAVLPKQLASELLEDWGEVDMADPRVLTKFITEAASRFPARRYALIAWNHGSGVSANGMLNDEDGKKGSMSIGQFAQAVQAALPVLPRKRLDLLKYELCLMGQLDVMAESAKIADYAFASPPIEPGQGSDYLSILPFFTESIATQDLTSRMVDSNIRYYTELGRPAAFSAYNLAHMAEVTESLRILTKDLQSLAPQRFKELTRATCFATHYENLLEDLGRGSRAMSSVELFDWLSHLSHEVPGVSLAAIENLRASVAKLVYHAGTTPNLPECRGVTLYIPLRREHEHPAYKNTSFARASGMAAYLATLYTAQDTLGEVKPSITNVTLGIPKLKQGRSGKNADDFVLLPTDHITPFARNVVRFDVTGVGILMTKLMQFEMRGQKRILHFEQLVADHSAKKVDATSNVLNEISPVYNDGTTTLMREIGTKYKVSNGTSLGDISIINVSASRNFTENVSFGYGLYRDSTTGGQDIFVEVQFSNLLRLPLKMVGYQLNAQGKPISMRAMMPRSDGVFRPAVTVLDSNFKKSRVFGPEMALTSGLFLLTVDTIDQGSHVGALILAETMSGAKAYGLSTTLPVRHNPAQTILKENALRFGANNLLGKYAMIQYASSSADETVALPTFQSLEFFGGQPFLSFRLWEATKEKGAGLVNWLPYGLPQISLHKKSARASLPLGETIQTWYAFLQGQGRERIWFCIGMGDGTRWALVPMEQYEGNFLEGVWTNERERWEFRGNTVTLSKAGHTKSGSFSCNGHILSASNMPANEYAVFLDTKHGRLTLMSRKGIASFLKREGGEFLVGEWISGAQTGYARLSIQQVPGTSYYNLRLVSTGQGETVCTFALSGKNLLATFRDGSHAVIQYALSNTQLTLYFPKMPEITFKKLQ